MIQSQTYNTDSLQAMKECPDGYFDLSIVDPPFGIDAPKMSMGTNRNRKDQKGGISISTQLKDNADTPSHLEWDTKTPSEEYFQQLFRISKNQIILGGNYFNLPPTRGIVCWDKLQYWDSFSQFELIWTSFNVPAKIFRLGGRGGSNDNEHKRIHPTQKPIKLYEFLLLQFAKKGDKILDTHLGSGSSRIACYKHGYDFTGYEINESYYNSQEKRFQEFYENAEQSLFRQK